MGKLYESKILTTAGFTFNAESPIDDRYAVEKFSDLEQLNAYEGLLVYVKENTKTYQARKIGNSYTFVEFGLSDDAKAALKEEFLTFFLEHEFEIDAN
jgi:hypothetical protein